MDAPPSAERTRLGNGVWLAGVVGIVFLVVFMFGGRLNSGEEVIDSPLVGRQVAPLVLEPMDDGPVVRLGDLRGGVVVINFWASWCVSCREELPVLAATATAYADDDVTFVGILHSDSPSRARTYLDNGARVEGFRYVSDEESRAAIEMGVYGQPETFIIGRDGTVVSRIWGPGSMPALAQAIDSALAGPAEQIKG